MDRTITFCLPALRLSHRESTCSSTGSSHNLKPKIPREVFFREVGDFVPYAFGMPLCLLAIFTLFGIVLNIGSTLFGGDTDTDPLEHEYLVLRGGSIKKSYTRDLDELVEILNDGVLIDSNLHDTLAVMIPFTYELSRPFSQNINQRSIYMSCALSFLIKNVLPFTPIVVYIWVLFSEVEKVSDVLNIAGMPVVVLPIPESSWQIPAGMTFNTNWNYAFYPEDYFKMGRWRLTFQYDFALAMGHQYMLQMDDDTFVYEPIRFNMVEFFRIKALRLGIRKTVFQEKQVLMRGLPELARFWMSSRNMTIPFGDIFNHTRPQNISGLHSNDPTSKEGWDRLSTVGCFLLFDVNYWLQEVIQDFVTLILKTGSDMEQRWQDQGVQNMAKLLFYPSHAIHRFEEMIVHSKVDMECLPEFGCGHALQLLHHELDVESYLEGSRFIQLIIHRGLLDTACFIYDCKATEPVAGPCVVGEAPEYTINHRLLPYLANFIVYHELDEYFDLEQIQAIVVERWHRRRSLKETNLSLDDIMLLFQNGDA